MGRPDAKAGQTGPHQRIRGTAERPAGAAGFPPLDERPRERLALHGAGALSAAELIGVLWGSGTHGRTAGSATGITLEHVNIDDWLFGVSSLSADGYESPVAFPDTARPVGANLTPKPMPK